MPVLISSCILLHGDLLKPWSYYLVEEQWTFSTVFDKIMRGELSSLESEAYAVDINQTVHRLVKASAWSLKYFHVVDKLYISIAIHMLNV